MFTITDELAVFNFMSEEQACDTLSWDQKIDRDWVTGHSLTQFCRVETIPVLTQIALRDDTDQLTIVDHSQAAKSPGLHVSFGPIQTGLGVIQLVTSIAIPFQSHKQSK